jgi:hypothetical protein
LRLITCSSRRSRRGIVPAGWITRPRHGLLICKWALGPVELEFYALDGLRLFVCLSKSISLRIDIPRVRITSEYSVHIISKLPSNFSDVSKHNLYMPNASGNGSELNSPVFHWIQPYVSGVFLAKALSQTQSPNMSTLRPSIRQKHPLSFDAWTNVSPESPIKRLE